MQKQRKKHLIWRYFTCPPHRILGKVFYNFFSKKTKWPVAREDAIFRTTPSNITKETKVILQNGQALRWSPSFRQSHHYHGNLKVTLNAPPSMKQGLMNSPPSPNNLMTLVGFESNQYPGSRANWGKKHLATEQKHGCLPLKWRSRSNSKNMCTSMHIILLKELFRHMYGTHISM